MREYVLSDTEHLYKIGLNGKKQLSLIVAKEERAVFSSVLTSHECRLFSADIDKNGTVHIAAVTANTLTYIRWSDGKTSTTHLMHLPASFEITSVIVTAGTQLILNYCVKSREGCACIEYSADEDGWHGKNIYTSVNELYLLCVSKRGERGYVMEKSKSSYVLINAYDSQNIVFEAQQPMTYAQLCGENILFESGGTIYCGSDELTAGNSIYAVERERLLYRCEGKLKVLAFNGTWHYSCEVSPPRGEKEYIVCTAGEEKHMILSSPFPYIRIPEAPVPQAGVMQEVYMQQRTLFALQAEVKNLKARVRKLEEERRAHLNMKQ